MKKYIPSLEEFILENKKTQSYLNWMVQMYIIIIIQNIGFLLV